MSLVSKGWRHRLSEINREELDCLATAKRIPDGTQTGDLDSKGNPVTTPVTVATDIPCRLARYGTQPLEGVFADRLEAGSKWIVTFGVGERRVKAQHLLDVSGSTNGTPWVRHLVVIEPLDPSSVEIMSQVLCNEP